MCSTRITSAHDGPGEKKKIKSNQKALGSRWVCVTGKTGHVLLVTQELAAKSIAPKYQKGGRKCPSRRREFCRVLLLEETGGGVEGRVRGRDFGLSEVRGAPRAMVCVRRFWPRPINSQFPPPPPKRKRGGLRSPCGRFACVYTKCTDIVMISHGWISGSSVGCFS